MNFFRKVERQFVILNNQQLVKLTGTQTAANSVLCFAYVDHEAGLTYQTIAATIYINGDYSIVDTMQLVSIKIRASTVPIEYVIRIRNRALSDQYKHIEDNIKEFYYTDSDVLRCRSVRALDQFRHAEYPDDVQVLFVKDGVSPEAIWVRTQKVLKEDCGTYLVEGIMLNTPYADYGVEAGTKIVFGTAVVDNNGTRLCFALLTEK